MTIQFQPINQPSSSKGWARFSAKSEGKPVIESRNGNEWVSAPHVGQVEPGSKIIVTVQTQLNHGKGRTARKETLTETYTLIAAEGESCIPGSVETESGMNGVINKYRVGGYVSVQGARIA
jgi:hypothetical protein